NHDAHRNLRPARRPRASRALPMGVERERARPFRGPRARALEPAVQRLRRRDRAAESVLQGWALSDSGDSTMWLGVNRFLRRETADHRPVFRDFAALIVRLLGAA